MTRFSKYRFALTAVFLYAALLVPWGGPVAACTLSADAPTGFDWPIIVRKNCSFIRAGSSPYSDMAGSYVMDLGNGRVAQRVSRETFCTRVLDYKLVADCHSREAIMTESVRYQNRLPRRFREFEGYVFPSEVSPKTFGWASGDSLNVVRQTVEARGIEVISATDFVAKLRWRNRFDPFCGCKHFYPDSEGAQK